MLAKIFSASLYGIDGILISVEVDIAPGMPTLSTVGLPDAAVREARDRVVSAVRNSGIDFPIRKITVNLAPADIKKEGASFDLPIAIGILAASEVISNQHLADWCMVGELALDGTLRPVKGALSLVLAAKSKQMKGIILPKDNAVEASIARGIQIYPAQNLKEVIQVLNQEKIEPVSEIATPTSQEKLSIDPHNDFAEVKGQIFAKRALEIAAAGGHNVLMIGPPGSGKTMLAKRITSILPPLSFEESIETTKIHSVAGALSKQKGLIAVRPFRNPHHTISHIALIGGGSNPRPGEVSMAHNGVLFLDELPEFHRTVLEVLRQPLENREVLISRARESFNFPASFMLVAAMNPCPCGFHGHPSRECLCSPYQIQKYMAKISGPLLDRIDIHLEVPALKLEELTNNTTTETTPSPEIRTRVLAARAAQKQRFADTPTQIYSNAMMSPALTKKFCMLDEPCQKLLTQAMQKLSLSARAYDRILKVARTIADLAESETITAAHLAEAIQYRTLDRSSTV